MRNFGQIFCCHICKKAIAGDYNRYHCDIAGIDYEFFTCEGICDKEFRGEYVDPFVPINNRFEILDL